MDRRVDSAPWLRSGIRAARWTYLIEPREAWPDEQREDVLARFLGVEIVGRRRRPDDPVRLALRNLREAGRRFFDELIRALWIDRLYEWISRKLGGGR